MKNIFASILLSATVCFASAQNKDLLQKVSLPINTRNLIVITIDGFRWQEIFSGADSVLISDERYTPDTSIMKMMYWSANYQDRRKQLMPFVWNVIAAKGQLYGNRNLANKVNNGQLYQQQLAQTIAALLGEEFRKKEIAQPISFR